MNQHTPEFRHSTSNAWEAAALWAAGFPIVDAQVDDGYTVTLIFPDCGDSLRQAVHDHARGALMVSSAAMREGYHQARDAMRQAQAGSPVGASA